MQTDTYHNLLADIAGEISKSRYKAAHYVNEQQLLLYYQIGKKLDEKISAAGWGAKVLEQISEDLQKKLPGLKGFSGKNLKKMRLFYQTYADLHPIIIGSTVLSQFEKPPASGSLANLLQHVSATTFLEVFKGLGFSHHCRLMALKEHAERWFYMTSAYKNQWSFRMLDFHIDTNYFHKQGKIAHNFSNTLPPEVQSRTIANFKDEYLLDFINSDPETERSLEHDIVANIKKFILGIGKGFAFIGNQYRLLVAETSFLSTCSSTTGICNAWSHLS